MFIDSKLTVGECVDLNGDVSNETMMRSFDYNHLNILNVKQEIPLTSSAIVEGLNSHWWKHREYWTIDSRIHMLMEGWYPCIPGWHHDDVPRTREDKQPNYEDEVRCEHAMFLMNADVAPTLFAIGGAEFSNVPHGDTVYEHWHSEVGQKIEAGLLQTFKCPDRTWVYFDDRTWHTGVKCPITFGHRLFIRIGMNYKVVDGKKVYIQPESRANQVRKNAQVYLDNPNKGW